MHWSFYLSLLAFAFCFLSFVVLFFRLIRKGSPKDLSAPAGPIGAGVFYANTAAMSPFQKESASMHLPTYLAGMIYHVGTFLALLFFLIQGLVLYRLSTNLEGSLSIAFFYVQHQKTLAILQMVLQWFWLISGACGVALLIKRIFSESLRPFTHPDDYISNLLTTLLHFVSAGYFFLVGSSWFLLYLLATTAFFLYMPWGKLRHALYYFFARYHLGFFYGRRGVWPPRKKEPMV